MAQQESSNDLPVIVGAIVVGLIAIGIFFFMRREATPAPAAPEPVRGPVNVTAVAPRYVETKVAPTPPEGRQGGGGTEVGAMGAGGGAAAGGAGAGRQGPVAAGVSGGG